ncbi:MAG TPA: Rid family hydrolase [Acidimicrobiia bacterium]|nr:Rid family hydrolase [Acidimicrobiia bacterium]
MTEYRVEHIHTEDNDPRWNMPYTPAIKVTGGSTVYVSGVTAAPVYHSHPHVPDEFDAIPGDPGEQAVMAMDNLKRVLEAAGAGLTDIVQMVRFMVDQERNQDAINRVMAEYLGEHRATSTSVEVVRLATDPRLVLELQAIASVPD